MIKVIKYIAILLVGFLWFTGCSKETANWLYEKELIKDDYRYGDLYRLSNLSEFRVPVEQCDPAVFQNPKDLEVILAGDSFTEEGRIKGEMLNATSFKRMHVAENAYLELSTQKEKVLIIQTVERHFRERFQSPWKGLKMEPMEKGDQGLLDHLLAFELPYSTQRHETVLFGYDWALTVKDMKASINRYLFKRIDENVKLSEDEEYLLYYLPSQPGISGNYTTFSQDELNKWVENVNKTATYYRNQGFDRVILSIIPNKTSILSGRDRDYNHLVQRVQSHPSLRVDFIDMLTPFQNGGAALFDAGDTHWNCKGKEIWLNKVNQLLASTSASSAL